MPQMIFMNLPVTNLHRSIAFYEAIGATNNPGFTDETAACMVLSDTIHVMLLTHDKFRQFTEKRIADAHGTAQMLLALSCASRDAVDEITERALAAGGRELHGKEDHGWMYSRAFDDPDGHGWGPFWMEPAVAEQGAPVLENA
jgi:predicted lactoylglutathione lyase